MRKLDPDLLAERTDPPEFYSAGEPAWWPIVRERIPGIRLAYALGMLGSVATPSFGPSPVPRSFLYSVSASLHRLGLRVKPGSGHDTLAVVKMAGPIGRRSKREMEALADWVAAELAPGRPFWDGTGPAVEAHGLGAYRAAQCASSLSEQHAARLPAELATWTGALLSSRRAGAAFLRELARRQRTRYANGLRRAAEFFEKEISEALTPLAMPLAGSRTRSGRRKHGGHTTPSCTAIARQANELLIVAETLAVEAVKCQLDAVLIRAHLSNLAADSLQADSTEWIGGAALQEMIYLARAGQRPFRQLAARRLAGADHPQAVATLVQLLYDSDALTGDTALDSLVRIAPSNLANILRDAYRNVPRDCRAPDPPLQPALLMALRDYPDEETRSLFDKALSDPETDPLSLELAAWLLSELHTDQSV